MSLLRVTLDIDESKACRLTELMEKRGLRDWGDLLSQGIVLLEWALHEVDRGRAIASIDEVGQRYMEVVLPVFKRQSGPEAKGKLE